MRCWHPTETASSSSCLICLQQLVAQTAQTDKSASIEVEMQDSPVESDSCVVQTQEHVQLSQDSTLALMPPELLAAISQEVVDLISRHEDIGSSRTARCGRADIRDLNLECWIEEQDARMDAEGEIWHDGDEFHRKMDLVWIYLYQQENDEIWGILCTMKGKEAAGFGGMEPKQILNMKKNIQTWKDRLVRFLRRTSDEKWQLDSMEEELRKLQL